MKWEKNPLESFQLNMELYRREKYVVNVSKLSRVLGSGWFSCFCEENVKNVESLTWPVSVSNLYNRIAGLLEPTSIFLGVIDGATMIQLTGLPE